MKTKVECLIEIERLNSLLKPLEDYAVHTSGVEEEMARLKRVVSELEERNSNQARIIHEQKQQIETLENELEWSHQAFKDVDEELSSSNDLIESLKMDIDIRDRSLPKNKTDDYVLI